MDSGWTKTLRNIFSMTKTDADFYAKSFEEIGKAFQYLILWLFIISDEFAVEMKKIGILAGLCAVLGG